LHSTSVVSREIVGRLLILAAAVLWGTTGTSQALAPVGASPTTVGALRLAIGAAALLALALARRELPGSWPWTRRATLIAAAGVAAYQLCFFGGVLRTGVAVGTIVAIGSAPIAAGLLGLVVRGETLGRRWLVATALAVLGCGLLVGGQGDLSADWLGVMLALGAGVSYAVYTVASKSLLESHPPTAAMAAVFCLGALLLAPLLVGADLTWLMTPRGLLVAGHLGLIATSLSYLLFARGLAVVSVAAAATLSLAEPLTAALLGLVVLQERLSPVSLVGAALLFGSLVVLAVGKPGHEMATNG
jgi:DME family drug/metabolite transporter